LCTIGHKLARHQPANVRDRLSEPPEQLPLPQPPGSISELQQRLQAGHPVAISATRCVVLGASGQPLMFQRRCPHEGADLALGHVRGQQLVCPWHNLPFGLNNGRSPCRTLPALKMKPCSLEEAFELSNKPAQHA
jgi:nitrite reductase/ring-hydroxylating ferredoxin subunit